MENLPPGPPPARDDSGEPGSPPAAASLSARERAPWRPAVAGVASLGTPVGIGMLNPLLGEVIASTEIVVALTVIAVALFGSQALSERPVRAEPVAAALRGRRARRRCS